MKHAFIQYLKEVVNAYDDNYPNLSWENAYVSILKKNRPELYELYFKDNPEVLNEKDLLKFLDFIRKRYV